MIGFFFLNETIYFLILYKKLLIYLFRNITNLVNILTFIL